MKIIIEGCDGTGKTTLAKKLAEKYNLDIVHITSKDPNDYDFYKQSLRKTNIVYDRNLLGEMIYPTVFKRKGNLTLKKLDNLIKYSKKQKVKILILTTYLDDIGKRLIKRGNECKQVLENLDFIDAEFMKLAQLFDIPVFDTSINSFDEICKYIEGDKHE